MFARLWMSENPSLLCLSSTDDFILLGVIHLWTSVVLECLVYYLYLAFVSCLCYRRSLVVSVYLVCTVFHLNHCIRFPFSKLVDSWFFGWSFLFLRVVCFLFRDKQVQVGEIVECQKALIFSSNLWHLTVLFVNKTQLYL